MDKDIRIERLLCIGCIVSDSFLSRVCHEIDMSLLQSDYIRTVIKWCIQYHIKYKKSPGKYIEQIYVERSKSQGVNPDYMENIQSFITSIHHQNECSQFNENYVLDKVKDYFLQQRLSIKIKVVKECLDNGNIDQAKKEFTTFNHRKSFLEAAATDDEPFHDDDLLRESLERKMVPLFMYQGKFGEIVNPEMYRGAFVALQASQKVGKSFWLLEFAMQSVRFKNNTALFQVGDMDKYQSMRRIAVYLAKKSNLRKHCKDVLIPTHDCKLNQFDTCILSERDNKVGILDDLESETLADFDIAERIGYKPCDVCRRTAGMERNYAGAIWYKRRPECDPLTLKESREHRETFKELHLKNTKFKRATYPNHTLTVDMIREKLDEWEAQDFIPDVVVLDYADNMRSDEKTDERGRIIDIWSNLSQIRLERNFLLITATQSNAEALKKGSDVTTFSGSVAKFNHVTSTFTINRDKDDRKNSTTQITKILCREDEFFPDEPVKVLSCLQIGRPYLGSI